MRIAGVRLPDGRLVWADAGDFELQPLDLATLQLDGEQLDGEVVVIPEHLFRPVDVEGRLIATQPRQEVAGQCDSLPGADMPPLGTAFAGGMVVAVDAVNRTVTIELRDGSRSSIAYNPTGGRAAL